MLETVHALIYINVDQLPGPSQLLLSGRLHAKGLWSDHPLKKKCERYCLTILNENITNNTITRLNDKNTLTRRVLLLLVYSTSIHLFVGDRNASWGQRLQNEEAEGWTQIGVVRRRGRVVWAELSFIRQVLSVDGGLRPFGWQHISYKSWGNCVGKQRHFATSYWQIIDSCWLDCVRIG